MPDVLSLSVFDKRFRIVGRRFGCPMAVNLHIYSATDGKKAEILLEKSSKLHKISNLGAV